MYKTRILYYIHVYEPVEYYLIILNNPFIIIADTTLLECVFILKNTISGRLKQLQKPRELQYTV